MSDLRLTNDGPSEVIRRMLELGAARQRAAAKNLANLETEGYQPRRVEFADHLGQAAGHVDMTATAPGHMAGRIAGPEAPDYIEVVEDGPAESRDVELERIVADLADAEIAYSTAARLMAKRIATLRTAVTGKP
jgi:flagellar basal-body rod protein FlgB